MVVDFNFRLLFWQRGRKPKKYPFLEGRVAKLETGTGALGKRATKLETKTGALGTRVDQLETDMSTDTGKVGILEKKTACISLDEKTEEDDDDVYFVGCNVNVRNGEGSTYATNRKGNVHQSPRARE